MALLIEKKQINDWLGQLKKNFTVIDMRKTILPAKQFFFPPQEKIFNFDIKKQRLTNPVDQKKILVFGLDLADLEAMTQLDEIMSKPQPDFFYWQRRKQAVLVGLTDESVSVPPGGDLILEKINRQQYRALVLNDKGRKISTNKFFKEVGQPPIRHYLVEETPLKKMLLDSELLAETVAWSVDHKIWHDLAKLCLGCGICTYLCPLCHCFSIEDRVNLDNTESTRCRHWDACTLPSFARIAGGHNFHASIKERYYNWFYHKFVRAYREYGRAQCVDCGRCQKYCPAGINIEKVLLEIVGDYKKAVKK